MPEAAEVRLNADFLNSVFDKNPIIGASINSGRFLKQKPQYWDWLSWDLFDLNQPFSISNVKSKGKYLYGKIEDTALSKILKEDVYFESTLGMTGFWTNKQLKHNHITFNTKDGENVSFNDARTFGNFNFITQTQLDKKLHSLGVDFFSGNGLMFEIMDKRIQDRLNSIKNTTQVCEVLMNQSIFCGVGNYIKAEALYKAKLHPAQRWNTLTQSQKIYLFSYCRGIIEKSYQNNGASFKSFKNSEGELNGQYAKYFNVYGKQKSPEGFPIVKEEFQDKRNTHFCPKIQKLF